MTHLILSLDYEIHGNGAGDVRRDVIEPTSRIFDICERHGAWMTIMFEVAEYWAFQRYEAQLRESLGYSPSKQMREQAIEAVRRGHDVQLHLHPQWIGARYEDAAWQLCNSHWRVADLPGGLGNDEQVASVVGALGAGKHTLEDMIKPVRKDYECLCFRAGCFYAQPSRDIIAAMKHVGLRADSSVVRGYRKKAPFEVDYSQVQTKKAAWWTTDTELTEEGRPGEHVIELSVSSAMEPYWMSFKKARRRCVARMCRLEKAARKQGSTDANVGCVPPLREILRRLVRKHPVTLDFCRLSSKDMLKRIARHAGHSEDPVVAIGHSKDFINDEEFDKLLGQVSEDQETVFQTMSEYVAQAEKAACTLGTDESASSELGGAEAA